MQVCMSRRNDIMVDIFGIDYCLKIILVLENMFFINQNTTTLFSAKNPIYVLDFHLPLLGGRSGLSVSSDALLECLG